MYRRITIARNVRAYDTYEIDLDVFDEDDPKRAELEEILSRIDDELTLTDEEAEEATELIESLYQSAVDTSFESADEPELEVSGD